MVRTFRTSTIAVDIDGTLAIPFDWSDDDMKKNIEGYKKAKTFERAKEALDSLQSRGFKIVLFSSRHEEDRELTLEWLNKNKIPFDELILNKPKYDIIIDDRAIAFSGDWNAVLRSVTAISGSGRGW